MVTTFAFSEKRIQRLEPPTDRERQYYKDEGYPGLQVAVFVSGAKVYYLVKRTDGRPVRHKLGSFEELSVKQARDAAAAIAGKIAMGENPQADRKMRRQESTLQVLWDHWLIYAGAHKKARSVEEDKRNWKLHLSHWANHRLGTIKKADVQALHSKMGTECGIYAANRTLALLRAMLNKADDIGYRGTNPAKGIQMFKEAARDRFLQTGELETFFASLESEPQLFRDFFLISLLTGARKSNVLSMRWNDLSLDDTAAFWKIPETKAGMPVILPLTPPALAILTSRREAANGSPWVFPGHRKGTHLQSPNKAWERIVKRAKLDDLRPHDLRRSLGSWMAGNNVSLTIVAKVLGHRPGSAATSIYARLAMDPQRQAMDAATTAMLTAGKQTKLLTVDVASEEVSNDGNAN